MSEAPLLEARDLRKTYRLGKVGVPVLRGADFRMRRGEWVAILGSSGSGKSTLMHLLGLLDEPDAGSGGVWFDGAPVAGLRGGARNAYRNRSVGFVFQFYHLLPELTVLENAMLPCRVAAGLLGWPAARSEARRRVPGGERCGGAISSAPSSCDDEALLTRAATKSARLSSSSCCSWHPPHWAKCLHGGVT